MCRLGAAGAGALAPCLVAFLLFAFGAPSARATRGTLVETEVRRWGFGGEQAIYASSLLLYAQAHFYDCAFDPIEHPVTRLPAASWQGFVVGRASSSEGDT